MEKIKLFKQNKPYSTILMLMVFSVTVTPLLVLAENPANSEWQVVVTANKPGNYTGNFEKTSFMLENC
jgi:hypothetical protein